MIIIIVYLEGLTIHIEFYTCIMIYSSLSWLSGPLYHCSNSSQLSGTDLNSINISVLVVMTWWGYRNIPVVTIGPMLRHFVPAPSSHGQYWGQVKQVNIIRELQLKIKWFKPFTLPLSHLRVLSTGLYPCTKAIKVSPPHPHLKVI